MKTITAIFTISLIFADRCYTFTSTPVPRITLDEFLISPTYNTPIIIKDISSSSALEQIVDDLMVTCGNDVVSLQHKQKRRNGMRTNIYDVTFRESIEYMMDSQHGDSYFAFCEGLLPASHALHQKWEQIREKPFPQTENWFDFFSPSLKPTDAIIVAGSGSTSTLHRDPFEWTGTSLCLEGVKIWRFILPPNDDVRVVDETLDSYRLNSVAWEEENGESAVLSAGWQSDLSLYGSVDKEFPNALDWMKLEEKDPVLFRKKIEQMTPMLCPNEDALNALNRISDGTSQATFATAIQSSGDLLLIPAHCWHQTFAPVPSVAIASQRCSASVDGANVVRHILDLSKNRSEAVPDLLKQSEFSEGSGREVVDALFSFVLR